jgi:hypothetical protein
MLPLITLDESRSRAPVDTARVRRDEAMTELWGLGWFWASKEPVLEGDEQAPSKKSQTGDDNATAKISHVLLSLLDSVNNDAYGLKETITYYWRYLPGFKTVMVTSLNIEPHVNGEEDTFSLFLKWERTEKLDVNDIIHNAQLGSTVRMDMKVNGVVSKKYGPILKGRVTAVALQDSEGKPYTSWSNRLTQLFGILPYYRYYLGEGLDVRLARLEKQRREAEAKMEAELRSSGWHKLPDGSLVRGQNEERLRELLYGPAKIPFEELLGSIHRAYQEVDLLQHELGPL